MIICLFASRAEDHFMPGLQLWLVFLHLYQGRDRFFALKSFHFYWNFRQLFKTRKSICFDLGGSEGGKVWMLEFSKKMRNSRSFLGTWREFMLRLCVLWNMLGINIACPCLLILFIWRLMHYQTVFGYFPVVKTRKSIYFGHVAGS